MEVRSVRSLIPAALRRAAKERLRAIQLSRAVRELVSLPHLDAVDASLIERIRRGWGNEGFSADSACLIDVLRHASAATGPIIECGSGLTTVLLGVAAMRRNVEVWSLEHDPAWRARTMSTLRRFSVDSVRVLQAPIVNYGSFSWYEPPLERLPRQFALAVCDGPPGSTPGGRYGLLPILGSRLRDAVIVMDDAGRPREAEVLERWRLESGWTAELRGTNCPHAIVRCT